MTSLEPNFLLSSRSAWYPQNVVTDYARARMIRRRYTGQAPGSVLVTMGRTMVLCTCCVEESVPPFLVGSGKGWLSAEYGMLPGSTSTRKPRDRGGKVDGRGVEIQRLIGRSLRAVVDLDKLGERLFDVHIVFYRHSLCCSAAKRATISSCAACRPPSTIN